jgi:hypothetical protein
MLYIDYNYSLTLLNMFMLHMIFYIVLCSLITFMPYSFRLDMMYNYLLMHYYNFMSHMLLASHYMLHFHSIMHLCLYNYYLHYYNNLYVLYYIFIIHMMP